MDTALCPVAVQPIDGVNGTLSRIGHGSSSVRGAARDCLFSPDWRTGGALEGELTR